jgi:membrane protein DedA with SNARE-associated domain
LIAAAVLAKHGNLEIELVIAVAAAAAIIGDNLGYLVSRRYGRQLLTRPGRTQARRLEILERGEAFFERHGPKAVFLGRWITGLRVWASWLAGITHMPWRSFLLWNALGGITWAITVGVTGYLLGTAAEQIIETAGIGAAIAIAVLAVGAYIYCHRRGKHRVASRRASVVREPEPSRPTSDD